jgi:L-threonylcarbamoyladenylate synthase
VVHTRTEVARAVDVLRDGGLVGFPTETVYGLGADAASTDAVRRVFAVKGRPADHPVIVHLADATRLDEWGTDVSDDARALAAACWPGPLTVVVRRSVHVLDEVTGGLDTVALRVPDQPLALELLRAFDGGIAAPSANRFGRVSPTTAGDVRADLGDDVDLVLDGGPCRVGVESTIVDCSGDAPAVLRLGGVPRERVEEILGRRVGVRDSGEVRAPGTLPSHYAPRAALELVTAAELDARITAAVALDERVGVIGDVDADPRADPRAVVLGTPRDGDDYAHDLYRMLRAADTRGLDRVLAIAPERGGLGAAVADRLRRAAGERDER